MRQNSEHSDELHQLKAQFLASMNHEIRTPLTGLVGMIDLLLETPLNAEQREYVETSRLCAENLLEIMNSTLEYSALSANQVKLDEAEFPLREVLDMCLSVFVSKAREKGLTVRRTIDSSVPEIVIGDPVRLKQLLCYLLGNAVKFTHRGEIEMTASGIPVGGWKFWVTIEVRDTGIGIPGDKLGTIFESFQQLEGGLARRFGGMGLGLAVSQKLAKLMNAELSVESELNKGSTFKVRLPLRTPGPVGPEGRITGYRGETGPDLQEESTLSPTTLVHS